MINVDRVYQTSLNILNKNGMAYITPQEFNLLANQAQIELFEEYFGDQARAMQGAMNDSDYSDMVRNLEEKISVFESTAINIIENDQDIWEYPMDFYRLGRVLLNNIIVDEVSHKDIAYINLSPLTAPTTKQPVYVRRGGGVMVYPTTMTDTDSVDMVYIRQPNVVQWNGSAMSGQFVANTSSNFELHPSEFPELVVKILGYMGLLVKQQDVQAAAQAKEAGMMQNEQ